MRAAVGFVDLCGFTRFTDREGDAAALQLALNLYADLDRNLEGSTRVVKRIGDGALLIADRTSDLEATLARTLSGWNPAKPIPLRATTAQGPVLEYEGDVFGALVNRAAHLLRGAQQGAIVSALTHPEPKGGFGRQGRAILSFARATSRLSPRPPHLSRLGPSNKASARFAPWVLAPSWGVSSGTT
jgi:hypothetical protein